MDNYCVYGHINKVNGKIYIGMTCMRPEVRWGRDGDGYKRQSRFYEEIKHFGWDNFIHIVFETGLCPEAASEIEQDLIKEFNTYDPGCGYNYKHGGQYQTESVRKQIGESERGEKHHYYGKHRDEETRKKISESLSGENHPCYGKHLPEITRKRIGDAHRGKPNNASYTMQRIRCIETGRIFNSICEAEREMNISHVLILRVLNGKMTQTHGYRFERVGEKYTSKISALKPND